MTYFGFFMCVISIAITSALLAISDHLAAIEHALNVLAGIAP